MAPVQRFVLLFAGAVLAMVSGAGCKSIRSAAYHGQRVIEAPGMGPDKMLGTVGSVVGSAAALPFTIILLPTLPFMKEPDRTHPSGTEDVVHEPLLLDPIYYGQGLGAFVMALPLLWMSRENEWPPVYEWRSFETSPGELVVEAPPPPGEAPPPTPEGR